MSCTGQVQKMDPLSNVQVYLKLLNGARNYQYIIKLINFKGIFLFENHVDLENIIRTSYSRTLYSTCLLFVVLVLILLCPFVRNY